MLPTHTLAQPVNSENVLFFVCPFCQIEHFVREHFGNVYFLTAPASVFHFENEEFNQELLAFLRRTGIRKLYFLCDSDCRFVNNAVSAQEAYGLACEEEIKRIKKSRDTSFTLARKLVSLQIQSCIKTGALADIIRENGIQLKGIISSKKKNRLTFIEVKAKHGVSNSH